MNKQTSVRICKPSYGTRLKKDFARNKYIYLLAVPMLIYYFIFQIAPLLGLTIAFQDFNLFKGFSDVKWVGLKHFKRFFNSPFAFRTVKNTFLLSFFSLLFSFPTPIILALLLNEVKPGRFKKSIQTISYMPHFISLVVICGMLVEFSSSTGLFNHIRQLLGMEPKSLLQDPGLFRQIYILSGIWQEVGWSSIIYLATLSTVDQSLYEAAYMDGAKRFQRMWYVTIPSLVPVITVQFIMRVGRILSVGFEKIILLYNPLTYETADVISSYVYRYGLGEHANYSFGTAVGIFNSIVSISLVIIVNKVFRRLSENSLW